MKDYIAFDVHKHYTYAERENIRTGKIYRCRINHSPGIIRSYLSDAEPGIPVAIEAMGSWYWIADEVEKAGLIPLLVNPKKAKDMMGNTCKTDKKDVHGLNHLQRNKTLPRVWMPPPEIRDKREIVRTRMFFTVQRAQLKNRIQATLAKYGFQMKSFSDVFGRKAREKMEELIDRLPSATSMTRDEMLMQLDSICKSIDRFEDKIDELIKETPEMQRLMTIPGIGRILSVVIALEIGDVGRFPSPEHLSSYSGCAPNIKSSGDKTYYGKLRKNVNRYLKWAFVEAANCIRLQMCRNSNNRFARTYRRVQRRKGHSKAIGAVARCICESSWHVLRLNKNYEEPVRAKKPGPIMGA